MELEIGVSWAIGLALAVTRAAAFVSFCAFVPKSIPRLGRTAFGLAMGLFIAQPIKNPDMSSTDLVVAAFTNTVVGGVIGWFLGLLFFSFQVAGTVVDLTSGVSLGSVFDPESGNTPGPFSMFYTLSAQTLIIAGGGLTALVHVLWLSTRAVALDGRLGNMSILGPTAVTQVNEMFRTGVLIALPLAAVLFVSELAFGLLSRLAPQINMFLIALPVKTLMSLSMLGTACVVFPKFTDRIVSDGIESAVRLLGG
jgi:flagellar biosynthetic protein FliR